MAKIKPPKIYHLCSLGTLGGYGGKKGEWSTAKKLGVLDPQNKLPRRKQRGISGNYLTATPQAAGY